MSQTDSDVSPSADGQGDGNITGFTSYDYGIGAKWLELLKEIAPSVTRVVVVCDPAINLRIGLWGALQSVSPSLGVELRPVDVRDAGEIERALAAFARPKNGGLIATHLAGSTAPAARGLLRSLFRRCRRLDFTIPIVLRSVVSPPATSIESLGARSRPTCRCRRRRSMSW